MRRSLLIFFISFILLAVVLLKGCQISKDSRIVVGVVAPMEHAAMDAIKEGVLEVLDSREDVVVRYFNAGGDLNLQHAMISQMENSDVDLIMPIGSSVMQMAINFIKKKPIVGLAANFSTEEQVALSAKNVTCVVDELPLAIHVKFMKKIIDDLNMITVIYSGSEKITPEIEELRELAIKEGLDVQFLLVQQMSDIFLLSSHISDKSQAIFILKDHLVVSSVVTLIDVARKLNIPLIAADEGSITEGASFAIGVTEMDIGKQGALMALDIIDGVRPVDIPVSTVEKNRLFVNRKACDCLGIEISQFEESGNEMCVELEIKDEVMQ